MERRRRREERKWKRIKGEGEEKIGWEKSTNVKGGKIRERRREEKVEKEERKKGGKITGGERRKDKRNTKRLQRKSNGSRSVSSYVAVWV